MRQSFAKFFTRSILGLLLVPVAALGQDSIDSFEIRRFQVEGNTLIEAPLVEQLLVPYTGKQRNFADVQRALEALEAAYQQRGFSVVQVSLPEQELNEGVVLLQVQETRLGSLRVEGNQFFDEANIRASLPGLRVGQTPNLARVSTSLKAANENPAKKTTLRLQAGAREGEVDAVIKVEDDKPWRLGASLDNSGNASTGKTMFTTQFQHANVAGADHVLSLQYTTTLEHPSQLSAVGAGYHVPLYGTGDSIDLFASHSDVNAGIILAGILNLPVTGQGTVLGARYNQNLGRIRDVESSLTYGLEHKAFRNSLLGNITVHPLSVGYAGAWTSSTSALNVGVAAVHNVPGGSQGSASDFSAARSGARAAYRALRFNANFTRALPKDWQARVAFSGQYSPDALISGEQFGAGGHTSVRGFGERDISGDSGHLFNAELYTPNLCSTVYGMASQCRALAFMDAASVRRNQPQPGEYLNASIASVGLGFRFGVEKNISLQMDLGHVLDAGFARAKGENRLHVKVAVSY